MYKNWTKFNECKNTLSSLQEDKKVWEEFFNSFEKVTSSRKGKVYLSEFWNSLNISGTRPYKLILKTAQTMIKEVLLRNHRLYCHTIEYINNNIMVVNTEKRN